jgi:purine-binding chemotaxis protein CheW
MVDRVEEVLRLDEGCIEETPETVAKGMDRQYIKGVGKLQDRLIIILDIEKVLSDSEKAHLQEISG